MSPELATGGDDGESRDDEAAVTLQSPDEGGLFGGEVLLRETPDDIKGGAGAEEEAASDQPEGSGPEDSDGVQAASPEREPSVKGEDASATDGTGPEGIEARLDRRRSRLGIGINEEQDLPLGRTGPGVAGGGDLPVLDGDETGSGGAGDLRCLIGRGVVDHDDLVREPGRVRGAADRRQGGGKLLLLVVGRDDEREHARSSGD